MYAPINHLLKTRSPTRRSLLEISVLSALLMLVACAVGFWLLNSSHELLPPAPGSSPVI